MPVEFTSIGVVRTNAANIPRHWSISDVAGTLEFDQDYAEGLRDIHPGERIVVLFHFDRSPPFDPEHLVQTSGDTGAKTGIFSTCSPIRPNPIGLSVVEVVGIRGSKIDVRGIDMLDGTPIFDLKPHVET